MASRYSFPSAHLGMDVNNDLPKADAFVLTTADATETYRLSVEKHHNAVVTLDASVNSSSEGILAIVVPCVPGFTCTLVNIATIDGQNTITVVMEHDGADFYGVAFDKDVAGNTEELIALGVADKITFSAGCVLGDCVRLQVVKGSADNVLCLAQATYADGDAGTITCA